nr:GTP cyclohydrolase II [Kibdelosporangium sp. MJ126-NF4]CTQ91372.1 GTP cyclohydrolase II (EC 3.5.4.25) [Kibdelosporangium sp. MJ126-NF4]
MAVDVVSFTGLSADEEHIAVIFPGNQGVPLVRVHSECLTGDVLGSARCDCGPQLREAIDSLARDGGILLYLRQEGRGIGLYNKIDAYHVQDTLGLDTFAANRHLNFKEDRRSYRTAAQMLIALGIDQVRLLSNNPDKVEQLTKHGIAVPEVLPTGFFVNDSNRGYLLTKMVSACHRFAGPVEGGT